MSQQITQPSASRSGGRAAARMLATGEFAMSAADFKTISGIMMAEAGISLPEAKANLVYSRLAKRLRMLGLADFAQYCALVEGPAGGEERQAMIAALTTNVTRFFREPHHFEHLKTQILPALLQSRSKIRLWSSACSTGQEPYSIALTLLALAPEAASLDIRILATDIDPVVLATAQTGEYDAAALDAVPAALRGRWFSAVKGEAGRFRIADAARGLIAFRKLNLIGHWPMHGSFQAIFCRNVVIYFEADTQEQIWTRMLPLLAPGGALYLGHSERVTGPAETALQSDGITIYRPNASGMAAGKTGGVRS
ncbi:MAG: chemotaxis protein [Acidocella sp. 20-63-7]|nr:MAG: chemotaxis protein [Acidocella sp. 20-63-7]